jgi:5-formyltetrahydrofolate cyclo-ligase
MDKNEIRRQVRAARDSMTAGARRKADAAILQSLTSTEAWKNSDKILTYVSFGSETDTHALMELALSEGKQLYCPLTQNRRIVTDRLSGRSVRDGGIMHFYRITDPGCLKKNRLGIEEPKEDPSMHLTELDPSCLMIMPGIAFDRTRARIGYRGGYYDRYLNDYSDRSRKEPQLHTCAICYSLQIVPSIPAEEHDRKPEFIVTEKEIIR